MLLINMLIACYFWWHTVYDIYLLRIEKLIMSTVLLLILGAGAVYIYYRMVVRFVGLMFNSKKGRR